jgi:diadenosine tetraphosphatase ApaH/serine/threonine PP2A family protein phosphatase
MHGLLYDVHGNLPALEAVLADARSAGVDRWVLGGDYALFGGWPRETVERLRELSPAVWIRGNGERWTADPSEAPDNAVVPAAIRAAREALGRELVDDLASLPFSCFVERMFVCHGSPVSDVRSFAPEPSDDEEELLAGTSAESVLFGHTHVPFARRSSVGDVELVNPGSVGMPFDGDTRAAYAIAHDDGAIEHRRVQYDHAASSARLRAFGAEWADIVALRIERAVMDV